MDKAPVVTLESHNLKGCQLHGYKFTDFSVLGDIKNYLKEELKYSGDVDGLSVEGNFSSVNVYRGIPFATAERFKKPVEITKWEGIKDCSKSGNVCFQTAFLIEHAKKLTGHLPWMNFEMSEDCLFLDIYRE